ncbi:aprataxin and PNK-like factor [Brienomyrus brachyistius]|uniref:aprataxin and PNK-like factor n=1 Tax=Brienomyrus brachyistius TaxID=42636 RepID=UPI0020B45D6C|nr:aprataxin and PNK-like factor [Brienomyrus brachyistius]
MPGFELEPVDGGGPIPLPQGETLLGRGPFLRVTDKRVSRHHGLLENSDGQLRIKPTHANPCFWQSAPEDPPQPLEKDSWHPLHPGEIFSLLPGKYIYRVVSSKEENTQRKSQVLAEDETGKGSQEENGLSDPVKADTAEGRIESGSERPRAGERKRVLPAWMMQAAAVVPSPPTPKGGKRDRGKATPSQAKAPSTTQGGRRAISSGDELEEGETEHSRRKGMKRGKSSEDVQSPSTSTSKGVKLGGGTASPPQAKTPSSTQGGRRAISSGDELEDGETEHSPGKGMKRKRSNEEDDTQSKASASSVTKARRPVRPIQAETSEESDDPERPSGNNGEPTSGTEKVAHSVNRKEGLGAKETSSQARNSQRVPCPYGKDCYRKNPIHFKECSHPGDSDFEEKPADEDDRPECPYGTSCYRKNPLHKKEYKHTKDPGKRASREEEYADLDDSLVDDSESVDDDSDYVPYESDDSANTKKQRKTLLRK